MPGIQSIKVLRRLQFLLLLFLLCGAPAWGVELTVPEAEIVSHCPEEYGPTCICRETADGVLDVVCTTSPGERDCHHDLQEALRIALRALEERVAVRLLEQKVFGEETVLRLKEVAARCAPEEE